MRHGPGSVAVAQGFVCPHCGAMTRSRFPPMGALTGSVRSEVLGGPTSIDLPILEDEDLSVLITGFEAELLGLLNRSLNPAQSRYEYRRNKRSASQYSDH